MVYYMKTGNTISVADGESISVTENLPVATYMVVRNREGGYLLQTAEPFEIPTKVYGSAHSQAERILKTFKDRDKSTGVLLVGDKGSGKTLLSKMLAAEGLKRGMPTLIVTSPWCGDNFNAFIQSINTECVIIFDEFEKVYDKEHQPHLLTLFDGLYDSKKLFVVTGNSRHMMDVNLFNRPGRMYYFYEYRGLDENFIREYCQDRLNNKDMIEKVVSLSVIYDSFNFDSLQTIVEEMNRFNESPKEVIHHVNAKPELGLGFYGLKVFNEETGKEWDWNSCTTVRVDPFDFYLDVYYGNYTAERKKKSTKKVAKARDEIENMMELSFKNEDFWKVDVKTKSFLYKKDGQVVALTKSYEKTFTYNELD